MAISTEFYVYILANQYNNVLYVGVTNDLVRRVYEHKSKAADGFTKRYSVDKLVYFEVAATAEAAIAREKQLKAGSRKKKIELIAKENAGYRDLFDEIAALRSQ